MPPGRSSALSGSPLISAICIEVVLRWDHRITDAAPIARVLTRLEQVLNTEIAAELRANRQQTEPKPVRAVAT